MKLLYKAYEIAKEVGLKYVYMGNIFNNKYSQTICPSCSEIVIYRSGNDFGIEEINLDHQGKCKNCGFQISIV